MKKLSSFFLVLIATISLTTSKAQYIKYENDSGWKLGFSMSSAWEQSDMKAKFGLGYGFTFGKSFSQKPGKFFAWDWAYRYQSGWNYGYDTFRDDSLVGVFDGNNTQNPVLNDYENNLGFIHRNYRVSVHEHNLELILTLNRLRERTGIVLYGWGGLGFVGYKVNTNQTDDFLGGSYNYGSLDSTNVSKGDLDFMWDNSYETDAIGNNGNRKWAILPSAGIGLGYQFSPYFTMGWEHKVTFPLNDEIDGKYSDQINHKYGTQTNDRFHYTGIYFRFHLGRGNGHVVNNNNNINNYTTTNTNTNTTTNITPVEKPKPIVDFTNPTPSYVTVNNQVYNVMANVYNVAGSSNITFKQNGVESTAFYYSTVTKEFSSQVLLQPGNNIFEIRAVNSEGFDYESRIVIYEIPFVLQAIPPVVTITNPPYSPYNTSSSTFNVTATVLNIDDASNISYRVNGVLNSNFSYNVTSKAFSSVITLNQGNNTIEIKATNTVGQDVKNAVINYQVAQVQQPPIVTITNPALNPYTIGVNSTTVEATVLNVASAADITLKINGTPTSAFTYNVTTKQMLIVSSLIDGANIFEITGTNSVGSDYKATTIIYVKPQTELPPVVTITDPATNPYAVTTNSKVVKGTVLNVAAASNITVKLNGNPITNFTYNTTTKVVQFTASNLQLGGNVVDISATNNVGSDAASTTIIYQKATTNPPPVVTITYPYQDPFNTNVNNVTVAASIMNVSSSADVTFKLNGTLNTNFSFDPTTDVFTANIVLLEGNNTIEVKGTNSVGSDTESSTLIYTKPCEIPSFSLLTPASATYNTSANSQQILIVANNVTAQSQLDVKVNGAAVPFTFDVNTHVITANAYLSIGDNNVTLNATTPCGSAVLPINIKYIKASQPPIVTITNPAVNPHTVTTAAFTVNATIQYVSTVSDVSFKLNGASNSSFTFNPSTTQFQSNITLIPGANVIEIKGTNADGVDSKTTTIIYQAPNPPCLTPIIALTQPSGNTTVSTVGNISVAAIVQNITGNTNIVLKQNGNVIATTYNSSGSLMTAAVTLVDGANNFEIVATNTCGSTNYNFSITYNRPLVPPVVTITTPSQNPWTSPTATTVINATIFNVAGSSNVTFNVNGNASTNFTYDANTDLFVSGNITLNTGNNTFTITGTNNDGTDSESTVIIYQPCNAPVVSITNPSANAVAQSSPYSFAGTVTNVSSSNEITLTQDGTPIPFSFNASNGSVTASINLSSGTNTIVLTALNSCGTDSKTRTLKFTPCLSPIILYSHPSNNGTIETTAPYLLQADITNATISSTYSLTHNGNTVSSFTVNNGHMSANVTLVPGLNTFEFTANNECGSITSSARVTLEQCNAPTVNISSPINGSAVTTNTVQVSATTNNVNGANEISATVNNVTVNGNFNSASGNYSFTANLNDGANTITVTVQNNCGSQTSAITVNKTVVPPADPMITICHIPPGNPNNPQTLQIPQSAWAAHQAHGDVMGECVVAPVDPEITICHHQGNSGNTQTMTILQSQWASHQAHGDELGECAPAVVDPMITICHIPPGNPNNPQTLQIPQSAWAAHQAHGDVMGECVVAPVDPEITICHHQGNSGNTQTMTILQSEWASHQAHGDELGECAPAVVDPMITICHIPPGNPNNPQTLQIPQSAWAAHQAHGDVMGECVVAPVDPEITICHHQGNSGNTQTMTILQSEWASHQAHGDELGECAPAVVDPMITICHIPPGNPNNPQTLQIPQSAWAAHQAHGDVMGECVVAPVDPEITICHHQGNSGNTQTMTILQSEWASHQAHGDELGECAPAVVDPMITICHIPPGNPNNPQTIQIPQSAWAAHQAHGDVMGECVVAPVDPEITICHHQGNSGNTQTMTILQSEWASHQAHGDELGECAPVVDPEITICHIPPGNEGNPQTITIPQSAWAAHQAHGDVMGTCVDNGNGNGSNGNGDGSGNGSGNNGNGSGNGDGNGDGNGNGNGNGNGDGNNGKMGTGEDDAKKKAAEEEAKRKAEAEAKLKAEEEAKKKAAEEEAKRKADADAKAKADAEAKRKAAEEEAKKKAAEEEAKRKADADAKLKADEEAKKKAAEEEAKRKAQEDANKNAQEDANRKAAEEEAKRKAQEEANRKAAEEEMKRKAQEEANRKAAEQEAKRQAGEDARRKAQEDANRKAADDEAKRKAQEDANRKAQDDANRKAADDEAKRKAQEEANKKAAEEEAKRKAEEENKKKEEEKKVEIKPGIKPR